MPQPPGFEAGVHVLVALVAILLAAFLAGIIYMWPHGGSAVGVRWVRVLSIVVAVLVWLSFITGGPVYVREYGEDKSAILKYQWSAPAHKVGMEMKEHIFYTGLMLATALPLLAYSLNLNSIWHRRLLLVILITLVIGGIVEDLLGGWVATAAKLAWSQMAKGG